MSIITKPGIYFDISPDDYFDDPCPEPSLTQSIAKLLNDQSPRHARAEHPRFAGERLLADDDEAEKYVKAQAIGNAAHLTLLGRGKRIAVASFDDWRSKDARLAKEAAIESGQIPILAAHHEIAELMASECRDQLDTIALHPDFKALRSAFREGHAEVVLAWQEDGIWLRTMIDWLTPDRRFAYDYKTGGVSFAPHTIAFKIDDDGWDVQAAMHERALAALDPENAGRVRFRFIAQENYEPFAVVPYELGEDHLTMGRKKLDRAIGVWRDCIKTGRWPGYPHGVIRPALHPAREARWLEREQAEWDADQARRAKATPGRMLKAELTEVLNAG